jgi:hypothetical protein
LEKACEKGISYFTDRRPMDFSRNQEEILEDDTGGTGKLGNAGILSQSAQIACCQRCKSTTWGAVPVLTGYII